MALRWRAGRLEQLQPGEVLDLLELRSQVFVVEQDCVYLDPGPEDRHPQTLHLMGRNAQGSLVAYARLLAPGVDGEGVAIGRVVTASAERGQGWGHELMEHALATIARTWPGQGVHLHAQVYLLDFYRRHGFYPVGAVYPLDGIDHQDMRWVEASPEAPMAP